MQLTTKYRPLALADFIGLNTPTRIMGRLTAQPWPSSWLFLGDSGTGKTTLAQAVAHQLGHHIPSRTCDLATVNRTVERCHYRPMEGGWHIVLVDEADQMSLAAQHSFLSILDGSTSPPETIFIFTANDQRKLEDRFLSRLKVLRFSGSDMKREAGLRLAEIWRAEGGTGPAPDFDQLYAASRFNFRTALNNLELELMEPGYTTTQAPGLAVLTRISPQRIGVNPERSAAAKKAWVTIRNNRRTA